MRFIFLLTLFLTFTGLVFVADVSSPQAFRYFNDSLFFAKQQLVWAIIGIIIMLLISRIHYSFWQKIAHTLFFINLALLIVVLLPGFGSRVLGARRWISLGPVSFQPAESIKLTLILYLATLRHKSKNNLYFIIPIALVAGLIMLEPDLGTTIIVTIIGLSQMFLSGISLTYLAGALGSGGLLGLILIAFSSYRRERFTHFLSGLEDPLNSSYHVKQILFALASGGLFGVGLGQSKQKYLFLPEAATDSVFAVIAEEIGLVGGVVIICLLSLLVFRIFKVAKQAPDTFSYLFSCGLGIWLSSQIIINLASMVALVPLTGVPLPFFSYGGSNLTMLLVGVGILLNITKYAKE